MNIQAMMKQAQKLQKDMMNVKEEIDSKEFVGESSLVKVTLKGTKEIVKVEIDKSNALDAEDLEMLEDMIMVAVNEAMKKIDEETEKINDDENIWMYWGDQTKEIRFMPSLVSNKRQIAFILNMESDYAKEMIKKDIWNIELVEAELKDFLDYRYYENFLKERLNRTAQTTDRESAIMFGLPS